MKVALIDLKESPKGCHNKDVAGTFGNAMQGEGLFAKAYGFFKRNKVKVPVLHLGYLSAIFRKAGHTVNYYESFPKDEELMIMASSIVGHGEELAFARQAKKKNPKSRIGFIGGFATAKPDIFLEGGGDFILAGEPETAALQIANEGLVPRGVVTSKLIEDLESLPFPDWQGFPVNRFLYWPAHRKSPVIPMLTSRGCSFDCAYCPYMVVQTPKFRGTGAKYVADEIQYLQKKYGVRSIVFRDIIFSINKKRTTEICEEILRRGIKLKFSCETRTDCLTEELLELLAKTGLDAIHLGIESPVDEIVKKNGRKPILESHQEKIIQACKRLGIKVYGFFILGFIQDTPQTMQRTIDYAKKLNPFLAQFDIMTPYPGTKYFDEVKDRITTYDWTQYTTYHPVLRLDNISAETLLEYKQKAYREFYFRWEWLLKNGFKVAFG